MDSALSGVPFFVIVSGDDPFQIEANVDAGDALADGFEQREQSRVMAGNHIKTLEEFFAQIFALVEFYVGFGFVFLLLFFCCGPGSG